MPDDDADTSGCLSPVTEESEDQSDTLAPDDISVITWANGTAHADRPGLAPGLNVYADSAEVFAPGGGCQEEGTTDCRAFFGDPDYSSPDSVFIDANGCDSIPAAGFEPMILSVFSGLHDETFEVPGELTISSAQLAIFRGAVTLSSGREAVAEAQFTCKPDESPFSGSFTLTDISDS